MTEEHTTIIHNITPEEKEREYKFHTEETKSLAIEMKINGIKYRDISAKLSVPENTLKEWFRKNGVLYERYLKTLSDRNDGMIKESELVLKRNIWNAVAVIGQALQEYVSVKTKCPKCKDDITVKMRVPTADRTRVAKEVIDRVLGKAVDNVNLTGNVGVSKYANLTDEQLRQQIEDLKSKSGGGGEATTVDGGTAEPIREESGS